MASTINADNGVASGTMTINNTSGNGSTSG